MIRKVDSVVKLSTKIKWTHKINNNSKKSDHNFIACFNQHSKDILS